MTTIYPSKIDAWLLAILIFAIAVTLFASVITITQSPAGWPIAAITCLIGVALPSWLFFATRYSVSDDLIFIRSGPFTWRVPIADITSIAETTNASASPALSLDRLRIDYGRGLAVMISPRDKAAFVSQAQSLRAAK